MARASAKAAGEKPEKKTKSSGGGGAKKKLTPYNKFIKEELARLKEESPDQPHVERFKIAAQNWKGAKENPKNAK